MTTAEAKDRLEKDPDFVNLKRFDYSVSQLLEKYPQGCPERVIAQALLITDDDVKTLDRVITRKLKRIMGVKNDD
jgi:hypothetical protein